jgi:excinuclease ABC subunit C
VECYDISNISGKHPTASRVVFIDGKPDKSHYRHYKIKSPDEPNDYLMMREVLMRRFGGVVGAGFKPAPTEGTLPDLLLIDGGKGQLGIALQVLKEFHLEHIPVVGIAKGSEKGEEKFFIPGRKNALKLKTGSPELHFLQHTALR